MKDRLTRNDSTDLRHQPLSIQQSHEAIQTLNTEDMHLQLPLMHGFKI